MQDHAGVSGRVPGAWLQDFNTRLPRPALEDADRLGSDLAKAACCTQVHVVYSDEQP